jgi:SAM-dependent methyltransferase
MEYDSINEKVLELVPVSSTQVLDLGCGCGSMGRAIRDRGAARVIGVSFNEREIEVARARLDAVVFADLNTLDPLSLGGPFDCVICSHVLEHLYDPIRLLTALHPVLTRNASIVVALPNVLAWRQRVQFLLGRFRYTDGGLMDRSHYRFFDWFTAHELFVQSGYRVVVARADGGFPLSRFLPGIGPSISRAAVRTFPGFFGWQFVFKATPIVVDPIAPSATSSSEIRRTLT